MKLNITTIRPNLEKQNKDYTRYIELDAFHKISKNVVNYMLSNKDCMISETNDGMNTMNIYSLYIFSPEALQKFSRSIAEQNSMNLPIVL